MGTKLHKPFQKHSELLYSESDGGISISGTRHREFQEYPNLLKDISVHLGAVYQLAPGALERAREVDSLRLVGKILMGFPSFLKFPKTIYKSIIDIILTDLLQDIIATSKGFGMGSTGGNLALVDSQPDGARFRVFKIEKPIHWR